MKKTIATLLLTTVIFSFLNFLLAQNKERKAMRSDLSASIIQTIGETELTISYYRLAADGQKIGDGVVPFNQIWFNGADNKVTFSCSKDILIENQPLKAGTYSMFILPTENMWSIMFSSLTKGKNFSTQDTLNNVIAVSVKPESAPYEEWLTFGFTDFTNTSAVVTLQWGKISISFTIATGNILVAMVEKSLKTQLAKNQIMPSESLEDIDIHPELTIQTSVEESKMPVDNSFDTAYREGVRYFSPPSQYEFHPFERSAIPLNTPSPVYPDFQQRSKIEGKVTVKMWVTKDGKVGKAEIVKSECEAFNQPALDAAMQWTFLPAIQNNLPVSVWIATEFHFKADDQ